MYLMVAICVAIFNNLLGMNDNSPPWRECWVVNRDICFLESYAPKDWRNREGMPIGEVACRRRHCAFSPNSLAFASVPLEEREE